jgi:hypothetical protein
VVQDEKSLAGARVMGGMVSEGRARKVTVVEFRVCETHQALGICHLEHRWQFEQHSPSKPHLLPPGEKAGMEDTGGSAVIAAEASVSDRNRATLATRNSIAATFATRL